MISISMQRFFILFLLCLMMVGCFKSGVSRKGSIQGYQKGIVYTHGGGRYFIGEIPSDWKRESISLKNIFLSHQKYQVSISISSFCEGAVDDAPLDKLSQQLLYDLSDIKILSQKKIKVDQTSALRKRISGKFNEKKVKLDTVVMKKDQCVFDLAYIASPRDYKNNISYFNQLLNQFRSIK